MKIKHLHHKKVLSVAFFSLLLVVVGTKNAFAQHESHARDIQSGPYFVGAWASPTAGGTVSGGGSYSFGDRCYLNATANPGYTFQYWKCADPDCSHPIVSQEASYTVDIGTNYHGHHAPGSYDADIYSFIACFSPLSTYNINVSSNPNDAGGVSGGGTYYEGSTCTLTAIPNTGYYFIKWTKNGTEVSTNPTYSFTVTEDGNYVAHFSNIYSVTATPNPTNGGTVTGGGDYIYGHSCTLNAVAASDYTFLNWTKDNTVVSLDASYSFTVIENSNYVANFTSNYCSISASASPSAGGTVSGAGTYLGGTTCTLTATPKTGYRFVRWKKDGNEVSTSASYSFTVTENASYVAVFSLKSYSIVAQANPMEGGIVDGGGTYNYGSTCTLTAMANTNYTFVNWTENGIEVSADSIYSFIVTRSRILVANFIRNERHFITSGVWSEASNWQGGELPEDIDAVVIDASCQLDQNATVAKLTVSDGQLLTLQSGQKLTVTNTLTNTATTGLVIEDGAQLLHASENVSATVKKTISSYGTNDGMYYLISNPLTSVVDPDSSSVYHLITGNYDLYDWLPSAHDNLEWRNFKDNTFLMSPEGYGYLYANQDDIELVFPGTLKPSNRPFFKSVSYDSSDAEHPSWNLIGNPFVCEAYLVNENYEFIPFYRMNAAGNGFELVASGAIAPMEGVFYQASENGTVYFVRITTYALNVIANPTEGGTVAGGGTYIEGQTCTVSATANSNCIFTNWTENGNVVSTDATYTFIVDADRTLVANFTTGAINGKFTINANGDQVYFSQGNLQYQASTNTWRFADNQWDYVGTQISEYGFIGGTVIGSDNNNISSSYSGWIDLFGWGTSGWNSGNTYYHPWDSNNSNGSLYGPHGQYNLTSFWCANADWGVYNPISNGGNQTKQWRTLTYNEWSYVLYSRSTASGIRYAKANVNNVNGVILLPDDWSSGTYSLSSTNTSNASFSSNTITASQWSTLEQAGAVFLPAAGYRNGASVNWVGSVGNYWSASYENSSNAYGVEFDGSGLYCSHNNRSSGLSVRLVHVAE